MYKYKNISLFLCLWPFRTHRFFSPSLASIVQLISFSNHKVFIHNLVEISLICQFKSAKFSHYFPDWFCKYFPLLLTNLFVCIKVVIWQERRQDIDIYMKSAIHIHHCCMSDKWHTFPCWRNMLPSIFQNYWLYSTESRKCTLFKIHKVCSICLSAFRIQTNSWISRIVLNLNLTINNFL